MRATGEAWLWLWLWLGHFDAMLGLIDYASVCVRQEMTRG